MAVHSTGGLALIELKDYTDGITTIPPNIDQIMITKKNDTIRLVKIINQYFERQLIFKLYKWFGLSFLISKEWIIWIEAIKHLKSGNYFFLGIVDY